MSQTIVGVRELKARLSAYLRLVKKGAVLVVSEHGVPIGRIVPEAAPAKARVEQLLRSGLVAWNGKKLPGRSPVAKARGARPVAEILLENRE
ncbi:MAG: type II toxin-antitoxin system prevent-host-death family antitoxin [Planctomycetes bacterium]|nr:type II toxin-antitoxin system prevent-host-death family antitoxin [Planctomycetota bacterium]